MVRAAWVLAHLGGSLHSGHAAGGLQEVTVRAAALETSQFVLLVIGHCLDLCPLSRTLLLTTSWGFEDRDGVLRLPSLWKDAATAITTCCGENGTIDGTRCVTRLGHAIKPVANEELRCFNVPVIQ